MFGTEHQNATATASSEQLKAWRAERGLLDIIADPADAIIGFIAECNAPDLHQFSQVLGLRQEIDVYQAILNHPQCDRATALNIFMACDPAYYDLALVNGKDPEEMLDEEDQVFLAIAVAAHAALTSTREWTSRFKINDYARWHNRRHTSPARYSFFTIPQKMLAPTKCEDANSPIIVEYSTIGLSFDAWKQRH